MTTQPPVESNRSGSHRGRAPAVLGVAPSADQRLRRLMESEWGWGHAFRRADAIHAQHDSPLEIMHHWDDPDAARSWGCCFAQAFLGNWNLNTMDTMVGIMIMAMEHRPRGLRSMLESLSPIWTAMGWPTREQDAGAESSSVLDGREIIRCRIFKNIHDNGALKAWGRALDAQHDVPDWISERMLPLAWFVDPCPRCLRDRYDAVKTADPWIRQAALIRFHTNRQPPGMEHMDLHPERQAALAASLVATWNDLRTAFPAITVEGWRWINRANPEAAAACAAGWIASLVRFQSNPFHRLSSLRATAVPPAAPTGEHADADVVSVLRTTMASATEEIRARVFAVTYKKLLSDNRLDEEKIRCWWAVSPHITPEQRREQQASLANPARTQADRLRLLQDCTPVPASPLWVNALQTCDPEWAARVAATHRLNTHDPQPLARRRHDRHGP